MFDYINKSYGLKIKRGTRVKMQGQEGKVTGVRNAHVLILFDDQKKSVPCHPTWEMEYID